MDAYERGGRGGYEGGRDMHGLEESRGRPDNAPARSRWGPAGGADRRQPQEDYPAKRRRY